MSVEAGVLKSIDAVILAGGLGTRLQGTVVDRPKPMAMVGDRPFLDLLINDLQRQGLRRFILCVGHRREQIISYYRTRTDADFVFSEEEAPLGTGGAVRHAVPLIRSDPFLVLNGDSLCRVDYERFLAFHHEKSARFSIVVAPARSRTDGSFLEIAKDGHILRFLEKAAITKVEKSLINAGIYLLSKSLSLSWRQPAPFSLEHDIFPQLVGKERCYAFSVDAEVMDIGTPERYVEAQRKL
jgi:NDP-sugar pyrophosphorylase family protein